MFSGNPFNRLIREEDGSFLSTLIFLVIVGAIIAIVLIDSISLFYANQATADGAQEAANQAYESYKTYRSDAVAQKVAVDYCESKDLTFVSFKLNSSQGHSYTVTCSKEATTYVFHYLPRVKDLIHQESTATSAMY